MISPVGSQPPRQATGGEHMFDPTIGEASDSTASGGYASAPAPVTTRSKQRWSKRERLRAGQAKSLATIAALRAESADLRRQLADCRAQLQFQHSLVLELTADRRLPPTAMFDLYDYSEVETGSDRDTMSASAGTQTDISVEHWQPDRFVNAVDLPAPTAFSSTSSSTSALPSRMSSHGIGDLHSSADAAAGAANSLECASPEPLTRTVAADATTGLKCAQCHLELQLSPVLFFGGGTSVKTLTVLGDGPCYSDLPDFNSQDFAAHSAHASLRAFDADSGKGQSDFNSQNLAGTCDDYCTPGSSNPGAQTSAVAEHEDCTPGSSNPGSQIGAEFLSLTRSEKSACVGYSDDNPVGEAVASPAPGISTEPVKHTIIQQGGPACDCALSSFGAVGTEQLDFKSQNLANTASLRAFGASSSEVLPTDIVTSGEGTSETTPCCPSTLQDTDLASDGRRDGIEQDFSSQHLAQTCGPTVEGNSSHLPSTKEELEDVVCKLELLLQRLADEHLDVARPIVLEQLQLAKSRLSEFKSEHQLAVLD